MNHPLCPHALLFPLLLRPERSQHSLLLPPSPQQNSTPPSDAAASSASPSHSRSPQTGTDIQQEARPPSIHPSASAELNVQQLLTALTIGLALLKSPTPKGDLSTGHKGAWDSARRIHSEQKVCEQVSVVVGWVKGARQMQHMRLVLGVST